MVVRNSQKINKKTTAKRFQAFTGGSLSCAHSSGLGKKDHYEGSSTLNTRPGNIPKRISRANSNPPHKTLERV